MIATDGMPHVTIPLGVLRGADEQPLLLALQMLAVEMLGHGADLEHAAQGLSDASDRVVRQRHAYDLRRYGWALWVVWVQAAHPEWRDTMPESETMKKLANEWELAIPGVVGDEARLVAEVLER